jgi:thiosulfate/3-mercaptopyruvate sulfurtransferase
MRIQAAAVMLAAMTGASPTPRTIRAPDSILVTTEWLAGHWSDPRVVVLDVEHEADAYRAAHVPGARFLEYMDVVVNRDGLSTELPDASELRRRLEPLGISNDSHVVLYGAALMVSRAFVALEYMGLTDVSVLDGGLTKWRSEGRRVTRDEPQVVAGKLTTRLRPEIIADAGWVRAHMDKRGVTFIDTRTDGEYLGSGERHGVRSAGHVQGARQLQWEQLFRDPNSLLFRDRDELAGLYSARARAGDTVVTYCYVGSRASMTYLVARSLGYAAKLYDGSYEDWSRRKLPLVAGAAPQ